MYLKNKPPVVDLVLKNDKDVILSINPDDAEKFKSGITVTGRWGYYDLHPPKQEDIATLYIVFKINGKQADGERQHISADIIDYSLFWFVNGGKCRDKFNCATDVKVFRKP